MEEKITGRPSKFEIVKERVLATLKKYPNGLTLGDLAKKTNLHKLTIRNHIDVKYGGELSSIIETERIIISKKYTIVKYKLHRRLS